MQPAEEGEHGAADHDVVEVRHDEVGVVDMLVDGQRGEVEAGEAAEDEQADVAHRVEHRRVEPQVAFVDRGRPVVDLDRRGHRDRE